MNRQKVVPFPNLPYRNWQTPREKSILDGKRRAAVARKFNKIRERNFDNDAPIDGDHMLQVAMRKECRLKKIQNYDWFSRKDLFVGHEKSKAYCNFRHGNHAMIRPETYEALDYPELFSEVRRDALEIVIHELVHILCGHYHEVRRLEDQWDSNTSLITAMHALGADHIHPPHRKMEAEVEVGLTAVLVHIPSLFSEPSLDEIQAVFDVSRERAYKAALLARDCVRQRAVEDSKKC